MSDDLVPRLRKGIHGRQTTDLLEEAADRIEKLEATLRGIAGSIVRPGTAAYELQQIAARALEGNS